MTDKDRAPHLSRPGAWHTLAVLCLLAFAHTGAAQPRVIRGFGDSLLDTGRVCARTGFPSGDYGTCSNGRGTLQWLPDYAPLVFDRAINLAEGGAGTGAFNVASLIIPDAAGAATQVQRFVTSGARIGATDLVVYSAGPNNRYLLGPAGPLFGSQYDPTLSGEGLADRSLAETHGSIGALIDAGGRNLVVFGGRARAVEGSPEQRYMATMNNGLAQSLNGFARDGTRLDGRRVRVYVPLHAAPRLDSRCGLGGRGGGLVAHPRASRAAHLPVRPGEREGRWRGPRLRACRSPARQRGGRRRAPGARSARAGRGTTS